MPKAKKPALQDVRDEVRANQEQIRGHGVILEEIRSLNRVTIEAIDRWGRSIIACPRSNVALLERPDGGITPEARQA